MKLTKRVLIKALKRNIFILFAWLIVLAGTNILSYDMGRQSARITSFRVAIYEAFEIYTNTDPIIGDILTEVIISDSQECSLYFGDYFIRAKVLVD